MDGWLHDRAIATLAAAAAEHREGESAARARDGCGPFVVVATRDGEGALSAFLFTSNYHTKVYKAHASSTAISTVPSIFAVRAGGGVQSDDDRRPVSGSGATGTPSIM